MTDVLTRGLDPTPPRPDRALAPPSDALHLRVHVDVAHLANPLVATSRLLASEAGALARVTGDDRRFDVAIARPAGQSDADLEAWVRWAVHTAGVRGSIERIEAGPGTETMLGS
ncbi:MAG: hypothetical protein ACTHN0_12770 [Aquihabitans sp.]